MELGRYFPNSLIKSTQSPIASNKYVILTTGKYSLHSSLGKLLSAIGTDGYGKPQSINM